MSLATGTTVGSYEILALIGAGGMGEVYRAKDTKLKRDVALKVLPGAFAGDPERMARFQREAEVLAALNHPNIAQIYGVEDRALVMELVEGESPKGPMAFEEAWKIASQIAAGLEYAHEKGIVHRDLKPANIKVTGDGVVKLLDFGLAKAFSSPAAVSANPENSPTLTLGATQLGVILGTAAYMAPEQAKGKAVDKRADIWSFGVVFYELLTGERLFKGDDVSDTLADVLKKEPNLDKVPVQTRRLLRECLSKDPKKRLRDIGDAERVLVEEVPNVPAPSVVVPPSRSRLAIIRTTAAIVFGLALAMLAFVHFGERPPEAAEFRYTVDTPEKTTILDFAVSPDGRYVVMAAGNNGSNLRLWLRPLGSLQAHPLQGTDGAFYPFWSPDSRYIGFFTPGKLKKVALNGGPTQTLCDAPAGRGGTWNREGVILFAPTPSGGLSRVAEAGGVPTPVTKADSSAAHHFPQFLPDGRRFLYLGSFPDEGQKDGIYLASLDNGESRRLMTDDGSPTYVPPLAGFRRGYLLFVREGTLMAQPLDPKSIQPAGDVFPLAEQVLSGFPNTGYGQYSASTAGVLAYLNGGLNRSTLRRQLVWLDRAGKELGAVGDPVFSGDFVLSPDLKRLLAERLVESPLLASDLWIHDLEHGTDSRFTFDLSTNRFPLWSPDGTRVVFWSSRTKAPGIYWKPSNGTGQDELLVPSTAPLNPYDWSRDGRFLVYRLNNTANTKDELWALPLTGDRKPIPLLKSQFNERMGQLSPDGHWLAYVSDESGKTEVYVQPFAPDRASGSGAGGKWQISVAGGTQPRWRGDGAELFYLSADRKLMAVAVRAGSAGFDRSTPQPLFTLPPMGGGQRSGPYFYSYQPIPNGKRFLVVKGADEAGASTPLTVVLNWQAGLKK